MDEGDKEQFKTLLHDKFNNNLKEVNQALVKHIELIERKNKQTNPLIKDIKIMTNL